MFEQFLDYVNVLGVAELSFPIAALIIWSIVWKGLALWKAARNGDKVWYVIILVVNTVGILEILYVFFFGKKNKQA